MAVLAACPRSGRAGSLGGVKLRGPGGRLCTRRRRVGEGKRAPTRWGGGGGPPRPSVKGGQWATQASMDWGRQGLTRGRAKRRETHAQRLS